MEQRERIARIEEQVTLGGIDPQGMSVPSMSEGRRLRYDVDDLGFGAFLSWRGVCK
jgi:hypothetical protein